MKNRGLSHSAGLVLAATLIAAAAAAQVRDLSPYKVVGGVGIYLGVLPSEMIRDRPGEQTDVTMHGGVPGGFHHHHVMVALFEGEGGKRITDARVLAKVAEVGLATDEKELEPMTVAGAMTYGNYFRMQSPGSYRISVQIRRPGSARPIEAQFEYRHD